MHCGGFPTHNYLIKTPRESLAGEQSTSAEARRSILPELSNQLMSQLSIASVSSANESSPRLSASFKKSPSAR